MKKEIRNLIPIHDVSLAVYLFRTGHLIMTRARKNEKLVFHVEANAAVEAEIRIYKQDYEIFQGITQNPRSSFSGQLKVEFK